MFVDFSWNFKPDGQGRGKGGNKYCVLDLPRHALHSNFVNLGHNLITFGLYETIFVKAFRGIRYGRSLSIIKHSDYITTYHYIIKTKKEKKTTTVNISRILKFSWI